jgi:glutamate-ammonia-ligase adenylyltransferase
MPVTVDEIDFRERSRAIRLLGRLGEVIPDGILHRILQQLSRSAAPDIALQSLLTFSGEQRQAFDRMIRQPGTLKAMLTVFSHSRFLTLEITQHPDWLAELTESSNLLVMPYDVGRFSSLLSAEARDISLAALPLSLAQFRRKQLLRILLRDVQQIAALAETTAELSHLADAILDFALRRIRHGVPAPDFSVLALGKLGGEELNYSSDIDLMFVFDGGDKEYFKTVANQLTEVLSTYTSEGLCYRVDLRLRPEGTLGEAAISLEAARNYYRHRARDWELQMLIKARVAAGDKIPGHALLDFVEPLIYSTTLDFSTVESASETRSRIHEKAAAKRAGRKALDIKLTSGGIRDIEFLVQCLQRLHGGREPWVRHGGTLLALQRLRDKDLLSAQEYTDLSTAYEFLRHLEHRLQSVDDQQTHALPAAAEQMTLLANRMPADEIGRDRSPEKLKQRLSLHLERVQELYERVIHAQKPIYYGILVESDDLTSHLDFPEQQQDARPLATNLVRFLNQKAPALASLLKRRRIRRNPEGVERFMEKLEQRPQLLSLVDETPRLASNFLDIFDHSPWLADALNRNPELLLDMKDPLRHSELLAVDDSRTLRLLYRQELFRILTQSLCERTPIFETLLRTSALANAVVEAAYRIAIEQVCASTPPAAGYVPRDQMMVVALGRLGMLEFDLASDADLIFVLRDSDEAQTPFWTQVAERVIDLLTAYTGDGTLFSVDTRLRPGGRDGLLVQLERTYKEYFEKRAQAWEGIAYMKARAIAGNVERATSFLNELQKLDWRRYGQSGRSKKDLLQMRLRLEREQGSANPLKAGRGGYYDIDFALMYLRLKGAGIFFKVLNTPERIDIVEQMGHLERADAEFLRDAATFYRAVDHGLRLQTGHSAGNLPAAPARLEQLTSMVERWTPDHLHDQELTVELAQIQARTREYFERLFTN